MRYRISDAADETSVPLDQSAFTSLAVLSVAIGLGFIVAGLRSRHYWMTLWGSGLSLASIGYLIYIFFLRY